MDEMSNPLYNTQQGTRTMFLEIEKLLGRGESTFNFLPRQDPILTVSCEPRNFGASTKR